MEKEKIEIEAQKKLIDIIFKNRSAATLPSSSTLLGGSDEQIVTPVSAFNENNLVINPVNLLESIGSSGSTISITPKNTILPTAAKVQN